MTGRLGTPESQLGDIVLGSPGGGGAPGIISDTISVSDDIVRSGTFGRTTSDTTSVDDALASSPGLIRTAEDTVATNESPSVGLSAIRSVADTLSLDEAAVASGVFSRGLSDTVVTHDFFGGSDAHSRTVVDSTAPAVVNEFNGGVGPDWTAYNGDLVSGPDAISVTNSFSGAEYNLAFPKNRTEIEGRFTVPDNTGYWYVEFDSRGNYVFVDNYFANFGDIGLYLNGNDIQLSPMAPGEYMLRAVLDHDINDVEYAKVWLATEPEPSAWDLEAARIAPSNDYPPSVWIEAESGTVSIDRGSWQPSVSDSLASTIEYHNFAKAIPDEVSQSPTFRELLLSMGPSAYWEFASPDPWKYFATVGPHFIANTDTEQTPSPLTTMGRYFDGSDFGNVPSYPEVTLGGAYAIVALVSRATVGTDDRILYKRYNYSLLIRADGRVAIDRPFYGEAAWSAPGAIVDDGWHLLVAVGTGISTIYIDGVDATAGRASPFFTTDSNTLYVGKDPDSPGGEFTGSIAGIALFTSSITPQQVAALWAAIPKRYDSVRSLPGGAGRLLYDSFSRTEQHTWGAGEIGDWGTPYDISSSIDVPIVDGKGTMTSPSAGYVSMRTQPTKIATSVAIDFDFYSCNAFVEAERPEYMFRVPRTAGYSSRDLYASWNLPPTSTGMEWYIDNGMGITMFIPHNTWVSVRSEMYASGARRIKAWIRGTTEPDWTEAQGTYAPSVLATDDWYFFIGGQDNVTAIDNVSIRILPGDGKVYGIFGVAAVIDQPLVERTFGVAAFISDGTVYSRPASYISTASSAATSNGIVAVPQIEIVLNDLLIAYVSVDRDLVSVPVRTRESRAADAIYGWEEHGFVESNTHLFAIYSLAGNPEHVNSRRATFEVYDPATGAPYGTKMVLGVVVVRGGALLQVSGPSYTNAPTAQTSQSQSVPAGVLSPQALMTQLIAAYTSEYDSTWAVVSPSLYEHIDQRIQYSASLMVAATTAGATAPGPTPALTVSSNYYVRPMNALISIETLLPDFLIGAWIEQGAFRIDALLQAARGFGADSFIVRATTHDRTTPHHGTFAATEVALARAIEALTVGTSLEDTLIEIDQRLSDLESGEP